MKKIWPFSFYFLYFGAIASIGPYLVLFYQTLGFSGTQIGLLTGIAPLITLVSVPFWTGLADSTGRHRLIMGVNMLVGITALLIFPRIETFILVFGLAMVFNIFFSSVPSFADSATMFMLGAEKEMYARVRLGGTIGFGIVAIIVGVLVQSQGLKLAFWGAAALFFGGFLVSQKLAHGSTTTRKIVNRGRIRELLKNPHWLLFLAIAFSGGMAFSALNTYFFPFMKELGASEGFMGLALTVGTIVEIPVLLFLNLLIKRFKPYRLLVFSLMITGLRLLLLAVAFSPIFALFVQVLNAFTFPLMWVAGVSYADEHAPIGMRTTSQGLFSAMLSGFGSAVGGFAGGLLFANLGGRGMYLVFGVVVFIILVLVTIVRKKLPIEERLVPSAMES